MCPWALRPTKRSLRIQVAYSNPMHHHLLAGVMDKALTFKAEGPKFQSRLGQWTPFKTYKVLFLIEDTSELEC